VSAPSNIVIRRAATADLPTILALLQLYYAEHDIWLRDPEEKTAADLAHPQLGFFLAEVDGTPAGCVLLRPLPSIPSATECKRLYIAPEFRGQRLAGKLMDAAEAHARHTGLDWVYLDSRADMATAVALYRRRGYEEIPRFNDNAEAAIFLRKRLVG
jgi:ribosomal protein S18 acetylase RimI-like enzyme